MPPVPRQPAAEWEIELQLDEEWLRVRKWRETQLVAGGFSDFGAFRLALLPGLDYHKALAMLAGGATETQVLDLLID